MVSAGPTWCSSWGGQKVEETSTPKANIHGDHPGEDTAPEHVNPTLSTLLDFVVCALATSVRNFAYQACVPKNSPSQVTDVTDDVPMHLFEGGRVSRT